MSKSIIDIIDTVSDSGILKPNQYTINISKPSMWSLRNDLDSSDDALKKLVIRAERVNIPTKSFTTVNVPTAFKNELGVPTGYEDFERLAINFILSADLRERTFFLRWMSNIIDKRNDRDIMFLDDITGEITVNIYNETESTTLTYVFKGVYPVSVGDLELSYSETDTYSTCAVTFAYRKYYEKYGYEDDSAGSERDRRSGTGAV